MFLDVLFSFQRTSHHLVLATLLSYHDCRMLSNDFFEILSFLSLNESLVRLSTQTNKKSTLAVHHHQLERVKRIELSQSAWKAEVLPLNYTRRYLMKGPATSYSRTCVLPSALRSLTAVFGMGTGVPSLPSSLDL